MEQEEYLYYSLFCKFSKGIGNIKGIEILSNPSKLNQIPLKDKKIEERVNKELELIEKHKVNVKTFFHPDYPEALRHIHNPPLILYYYGKLPTNFCFAIVGTRNPSKYGVTTTQMMVSDFANYDISIVSGFADGIDAIVHESSLQNKIPTIAILGCGINVQYPQRNTWMRKKIIEEGGAIISEFPIGSGPFPSYFPIRNRVISGISKGVLIVEAGLKSGSLITAKLALEQGKNIYSIPGTVFGSSFKGNHHLIRLGATLAESANQILLEYPEFSHIKEKKEDIKLPKEAKLSEKENKKSFIDLDEDNKEKKLAVKQDLLSKLTSEEMVVYYILTEKVPIEVIIAKTNYTAPKTLATLTSLILKGLAVEEGGLYFGI